MIIKKITIEQVLPIRQIAMYPDKALEELTLIQDHEGIHLGAFNKANQLVSVISLFKREDELQFRKFATLPKEQGKGYGKLLLSYILDDSKNQQITRVWCNARVNALEFYKQFGFKETNQTYHLDGYDFVIVELFL